jgi:N-acetylglucosaminyl-diphospho-decaprenol L-rhamnosyltransferase
MHRNDCDPLTKASLEIIVVNWNSGGQLLNCMQSVQAACREGFELRQVVVVDNASSDGSADQVKSLGLPLRIISNPSNRGFAAACNQGAEGSVADYLLFLNPDVRLSDESLRASLEFMQDAKNAGIGICGIRLLDDEGHLARTCARFPTPELFFSWMLGLNRLFPRQFRSLFLDEPEIRESRTVDQVMGAFFIVRWAVFRTLSGFDERFFVYFEDLDFSYRARQEGWESYYLASVTAYHAGQGCSNQAKAARLFYWLRSRSLYCYKHFGTVVGTLLLASAILIEPVTRLVLAVSHWSLGEIGEILRGYSMFFREIPTFIRIRRKV